MNMNRLVMMKVADMSVKAKKETKVELANLNDFRNLTASADTLLKKVNDAYGALTKTIPSVLGNGNQFLSVMENLGGLSMDFDKKFTEIGMDWKSSPEYKKYRDIITASREVNNIISRVKNL